MTVEWTPEEDVLLLSLRGDGYRWYEIAMRLGERTGMDCQYRHAALGAADPSTPLPAPVNIEPFRETQRPRSYVDPSTRLLRAQLRTGQYFPQQRAEYLARHGEDSE